MGWDHDQRMAKLPLFFSTRLIIQPTIPLVSLSSGRRLQRRIVEETGGRAIEDLWIRFYSASTNLSRATQVVHDRGQLSTALRASVSLPGVLPPVQSGADLLVDGGLLNNLPIDVMQAALGGGRVVAVDLRRQVELRMQARISPALSGWEVLFRRLGRGSAAFDPPSVGAILQRSVELAGLLNERALLGRPGLDLYLCPPVGRLGTFDFASAPLLVDDARRYARDQLTDAARARLLDVDRLPLEVGAVTD
jgi:predicted acylesterase/phospholipase RssA